MHKFIWLYFLVLAVVFPSLSLGDPYPPSLSNGAKHFDPAPWPSEPINPKDCTTNCGDWQPYSRFQSDISDPRVQDPSNGGTAPQNYVNVSSSCIDKTYPSIYYYLKKGATEADDVIMFRWRVEQIANNYATGPSAGNYGATDPWSSALWTVLFDLDGDGYRDIAAHLDGSSGSPSKPIDLLAGIWGNIPTQSIDYLNDTNIKLIAHNPTGFTQGSTLLNFHDNVTPDTTWPAGSSTNSWDYGTSRAKLVYTNACTEYFVDYQIPVRMLDASSLGGPKITRNTPISMLFCTANSLNNPFQKDCALNRAFTGDASKPAPYGDYLSFNKEEAYAQPIISSVTATAPTACSSPSYTLTAKVQDTLYVNSSGVIEPSIQSVKFFYWYDKDGDGTTTNDAGSSWTLAADGVLKSGTLNTWTATWNAGSLPKGRYLIGVQAVDDRTKHDDGVLDAPVNNRTFSYLSGSTVTVNPPPTDADLAVQAKIYTNDWRFNGTTKIWDHGTVIGWIGVVTVGTNQQTAFAAQPHAVPMTEGSTEDWYGNPDVTGTQIATTGVDLAINACGVAPTITKSANVSSVTGGQEVIFTLVVSNPITNPNSVTLNQFQDTLPDGFTYKANSTTGIFGTTEPTPNAQSLTWSGSTSISPGSTASLSFTAIAPSLVGSYNNVSRAETDFGQIISNPVTIGVGAPRLSVNKTPSVYSSTPGSTITYTITYSNDSTVNVTNAAISDVLPTGVTYINASCTGSCTYTSGTRTLTWDLGDIDSGQRPFTVSFQVTVDSPYTGASVNENTAGITSTETTEATSTASVYIDTPRPQLTLSKISNNIQINPGSNVTFTLNYANTGNADTTNVVLTDPIPNGFTFISATNPLGANCTTTPSICSNSSGTVTWNLGTLAAGATGSVTVTLQAGSPFTGIDNPVINTASISSTQVTTPVTDSAEVGISQTGTVCSTYYFRPDTGNIGFDGIKQLATKSPIPLAGDTGTSNTVTAPGKSGGLYTEALRFYQDPKNLSDTNFNGNLTTNIYIDRSPGQGLTIKTTVYDYNSVSGAKSSLGQNITTFNGSTKGLLAFTVTLSGTLQKDHRLLWIFEVQSDHNTITVPVQFQYNGTVTNAYSGSTTFANSYANYCVTPPANLVLEKSVNTTSMSVSGTNRTLIYTLNYSNTGSTTAINTAIVDTLPSGVTLVSANLNNSPITPSGSNPYTYSVGSVAGGDSGSLAITVNVDDDLTGKTSLINTAQLQSDQTSLAPTGGATATTTITGTTSNPSGTPNVLVTKQASKTLLLPSESTTYTLTAVNAGDKTATSVVVSDTLPVQSYFDASGSCTTAKGTCGIVSGALTWTIGSLSPGESVTLNVTMLAGSSLPAGVTVLDNTATATYSGGGTGTATSNTVSVSISGNPNLTLTKTASPTTPLAPGDTVTYTFALANTGSAAANAVVVNDPIPANMSFFGGLSASDDDNANGNWSSSFDAVNNQVVFSVNNLGSGKTATLSFQAKVITTLANGNTTLTNIGTVSASNALPKTADASSTASAAPKLTLNKSGPTSLPFPSTVLTADASNSTTLFVNSTAAFSIGQDLRIGSSIAKITGLSATSILVDSAITASSGAPVIGSANYTLTYQNTGNASADSVTVSDTLPVSFLYLSASPAASSAPTPGSTGTVTWSIGTVAAGGSGSVQVTVIPTATGSFTNSASLTDSVYCQGGTPPASCSDSLNTLVGGLEVTKATSTPSRSAQSPNNIATYTMTVTNTTGSTISDVSVKDLLPAGFTYQSGSTLINNAPASNPTFEAGDLGRPIWTVDVPANSSVTINFNAEIASTVGPATYQNGVELTKAGVGITPFDPLATTAEDVTVLSSGTGIVQGTVYKDNDALSDTFNPTVDIPLLGVAVTLIDSTGTVYVVYTDAAGHFSRVVAAGSTIVDVDNSTLPAGLTLTSGTDGSDPTTVVVPDGGTATDNTGFVATSGPVGSITGNVFEDANTSQIKDSGEIDMLGIQVLLRDANNTIVATAYTDILGNYAFPNIPYGDYKVDIVPALGYFVTTANDPSPVTISSSTPVSRNFGLKLGQTLSGTVFNDNGIGGGTSTNGIKDGTESGINPGSLNVIIVDSSNNVIAVAPVNSDGTWSAGVPSGTGYQAFISTANPNLGIQFQQPVATLPSGWITTGENDATADSVIIAIAANSNVSGLNFGIKTTVADLTIAKSHTGSFAKGQTGATYSIVVTNSGSAATSGTVTVTDTLPNGLTATAISGTGWTCDLNPLSCTRSDALAASASYPEITLTVNVSSNAAASLTNSAQVSLPGEVNTSNNTATDTTTITTSAAQPGLSIVKTAYEGHNSGAGCPGVKTLVVVDVNRVSKPITWCFEVTNTGDSHLANPVFDDALLNINALNQASVQLASGTFPLAPTATATWYVEENRTSSLDNQVTLKMDAVNDQGVSLNLPVVQSSDSGTVFAYIFDPPFGIKTGTVNGVNKVRWTMVWINDSPITADDVLITDPPPVDMTYVANSIQCTPRGISTVASCTFEAPSVQFPRGRVLVSADLGPDAGAVDAATAGNELEISFDVTVPATSTKTYYNQGTAEWHPDPSNPDFMISAVTNDQSRLGSTPGSVLPIPSPVTVPSQPTPNVTRAIPTLSEWLLMLLAGLVILVAFNRLERGTKI